jgi:hypothetical protein
MSFFGQILDKLGLGAAKAEPNPPSEAAPVEAVADPAPTPPATQAATQAEGAATAIAAVDVAAKLGGLAAANPQKLNWKTSIVDLLKLLDLDSSLTARKALATELGCPADRMGDSAAMNIWLHKAVLRKLANNGGNVPADLLD